MDGFNLSWTVMTQVFFDLASDFLGMVSSMVYVYPIVTTFGLKGKLNETREHRNKTI